MRSIYSDSEKPFGPELAKWLWFSQLVHRQSNKK